MDVLKIALLLCLGVFFVRSDIKNPIQSWTEPMVLRYKHIPYLDFIPVTTTAAAVKGWYFVPTKHHDNVKTYCPWEDRTLCTLHDKNGRIVGVMLTVDKNNWNTFRQTFKYYESQWFQIRTIALKEYYTLDIYFVSKDHLDNPGSPVGQVTSVGETFRIMHNDSTWTEVPVQENKLAQQDWEKQNCEVHKGTHYVHKVKETKTCQDWLPIVLLVKNQHLVGFSFIVPGTYKSEILLETQAIDIIRRFPNASDCLQAWAPLYKVSSLYVTLAPIKNMKRCDKSDHIKPPSAFTNILSFFGGK